MVVSWRRVQVVRIDAEGHQVQGVERGRVADGHVVGRLDGLGGHVRSCAGAHEGHALVQHHLVDGLDQVVLVERGQQAEGVAAADEDRLCVVDSLDGIGEGVDALDGQVPLGEGLRSGLGVVVKVEEGVGDEEDALDVVPGGGIEEGIPGEPMNRGGG